MLPFREPVYVSRPLLPPLDELTERLGEVWASRWLTNGGAQHERLETALRLHLGAEHLSLFNNGTIALLTAVRALGCTGSVVTTPFTFPATPHVLAWSGIEPVFCDIDPVSLTIDPERLEAAIRKDTTGILAVHVYGLPCDVVRLQALAARRGLRLLYDAAHAFGTTIAGAGVAAFGDATMFSFHATKLFHTAEGGALTTRDAPLKAAFDHLKNFGICNQEEVDVPGINGKMNEIQAALGLAVLEHVALEVDRRRAVVARYRAHLSSIAGVTLMPEPPGVVTSCQYFVIRIGERSFGASRDAVQAGLRQHNVLTRKYFFPLCSDYPCYSHLPSAQPSNLRVARRVAEEVLCLPIYGDLPLDAVDRICEMLLALRATEVPRTGGAA
jgi:dTDP-4-amino-4,6-dideoxygalactose transaminase